jgi:hypothetical protein
MAVERYDDEPVPTSEIIWAILIIRHGSKNQLSYPRSDIVCVSKWRVAGT